MNFSSIESKLKKGKIPLAVCMPEEPDVILAAAEAAELGVVETILVGKREKIESVIRNHSPGFKAEIVDIENDELAAKKCVELVKEGRAKALMKGTVSTPVFLKAILNSETGIKKGALLSHVLIFEWKGRFRFLTDGGMVPHPTLAEKKEILNNVLWLAHSYGFEKPRVAILSAVETVNEKMQSTLDAAVLSKMGERKQFGSCIVDGPLALDNAISKEAAHHKGIFNDVAGEAEILICPDIDTGNVLGKSILYFTDCRSGGLLIGAQVPVVMLSRSDTKQVRLDSIKLALAAG
ncbi:MAG: bifunctional enoyl-CoA hydratase/phosphate acetyltransferase [Candidatus Riflebacteria bacterium]|nr:bifunctional enoyl-CoA hydratase/phosphate acetyltransferase [Candidatus Riflebacteria bacterium]